MRKDLKLFKKDEKGATAIEFAMVAPVLFWLIFGIIEFGMIMATQSALEGGISRAAREYKALARSNSAGASPNDVKNLVVRYAGGLLRDHTPGNDVNVVLSTISWGGSSAGSLPANSAGSTGSTGVVLQYRAYYRYNVMTPLLGRILRPSGGDLWLMASTAVQNEPSIGGGGGV